MNDGSNPFSPPKVDTYTEATRGGSRLWAVVAGFVTDIGGSMVAGILTAGVVGAVLGAQGIPPEQIQEFFSSSDPYSWFMVINYLVGCAVSVLGGYVCARIARRDEYKLGGILAASVIAFGLLLFSAGNASRPMALHVGLVLITVASVTLGAWLGAVSNQRALRRI